ncbi:MAG: hypothetical protein ACXQS2_05075 [Methermicoccaceae archaeon]
MGYKNNTVVPAIIKRIGTSSRKAEVIFSLRDVMGNKQLLVTKDKVLDDFYNLTIRITDIIDSHRVADIPRKKIWDIGYAILRAREKIVEKYGVDISNTIQAVAEEVGLSESSVRYIVRFSIVLPKSRVKEEIIWSKYQEAMDMVSKADFNGCISLIERGELRTSKDVRKYVREKNAERRRK